MCYFSIDCPLLRGLMMTIECDFQVSGLCEKYLDHPDPDKRRNLPVIYAPAGVYNSIDSQMVRQLLKLVEMNSKLTGLCEKYLDP